MKKLVIALSVLTTSAILLIGALWFYNKNNEPKKETTPSKEVELEEYEDKVSKISFIATGDALIHGAVYKRAYKNGIYDFNYQIEHIKPIIEGYDLAFYNQETIFGGSSLGYSHYPRFNTPSEFGDAMLAAGFNIVGLANNHSLDKGEIGVNNAINYWQNTKVLWDGINTNQAMQDEKPKIYEKNGITYTMLSYTTTTNGLYISSKPYLVNVYSKELVLKDINAIKDEVDIIMVSMHWGNEYWQTPAAEQIAIAEYLSSLGVSIIIGHHPHVLQPITKINNTIVMYSLGNFISAQDTNTKLTGMLVSLDITKTTNKSGTIIEIDNLNAELIYTVKAKGYVVTPYTMLNDGVLPGYKTLYENQKKVIQSLDPTISVTPLTK